MPGSVGMRWELFTLPGSFFLAQAFNLFDTDGSGTIDPKVCASASSDRTVTGAWR